MSAAYPPATEGPEADGGTLAPAAKFSHFLALPSEIRVMIYDLVLPIGSVISLHLPW
jgi:hypothetical protein